jgi:AcrR family transcriptional regulator
MTDAVPQRHAGRPRHAVLDKKRIAEAALAIVDETGAFTAPELARRLGVQTPSIYHYVDGRAGVIELLRARIGGLIDPAPLELRPAEDALRAFFRSYREVFAAHARVLPLLATSTVRSPEVMPAYERLAALLLEIGIPAGDVMAVLTAVENFILGSALDLAGPEVMWDIPEGVEAPHLTEVLAAQPAGTRRADRAFDLGLDTMLGLMLRAGRRP